MPKGWGMDTGSVGAGRRGLRAVRVLGATLSMAAVTTLSVTAAPTASAATAPMTAVTAAPTAAPGVAVWHQPRLTKLVTMARKLTTMHVPYSSGGHGATPAAVGSSVDCSGLVRQLYHYAFGVDIGRGTGDSMVRTSGTFVKTSHPVPGDVVLFGSGGHAPAYHAMIYVGTIGGRPTAVASPDWGETIKYQYPTSAYWIGDLMGYWHYKGADKQDSATSAQQPSVRVKLLSARSGNGTLVVTGYAFDPMNPSRSVAVDVYASGHRIARVTANESSPGVNKTYHLTGRHRLQATIPLAAGRHPFRLLAHHVAPDRVKDAWSAQGHITITRKTLAVIWSARAATTASGHKALRITGYGYDRLRRGTVPRMQVLVDGKVLRTFTADLPSPNMNKSHQLSGPHRYDVTVPVTSGTHTVQVRTLKIATYSVAGATRVFTVKA